MEHGLALGVAIVACVGLAAGAAMRGLGRRTGLPYTVAMLVLGLAVGFGLRQWVARGGHAPLELFGGELPGLSADLILFVFLPALVFESAFALDVHAFRRNLVTIAILAVPALAVAIGLTALVTWGLAGTLWGWGLGAALVFGALISATDPVAVVAVLRELGAPKRLSTLIEGESLLNDGTAIVAFTVVLGLLAPAAVGIEAGATALELVRVVAGGVAVGLVLAWLATAWIARTFNDPLVEITVTLVLAYGAMILAESVLHVSGVMAIVTAGLFMAGPGQTRISPEIRHFLHRVWEVLAFLANTLIFALAGVVIALQLHAAAWIDLALIPLVFVGVVAVRFVVVYAVVPITRRMPEPVRAREAAVMAWGGLRGAVSLALALVVSQHEELSPELRAQVLRLTAGIVLLTILLNGTTTGWLLRKLGFATPTDSERLADREALVAALAGVERRIAQVRADAELSALPWREVRREVDRRRRALEAEAEALRSRVAAQGDRERTLERWRLAVRVEREAYWRSFADGVLGRVALQALLRATDEHLDALRAGRVDPPARRAPDPRGIRSWVAARLRRLGVPFGAVELGRLALLYDTSRAEAEAANAALTALAELDPVDGADAVRETYERWRRQGKARLEDLRANLPEVVAALEARLAARIALNFEREQLEALAARGALGGPAAERARHHVETRMKQLSHGPPEVALPDAVEVCRHTPLLRGLDEEAREELAGLMIEQALEPGDVLFEQGDPGDAMYVVARGALRVRRHDEEGRERQLDVVSTGEVVGEMALLSDAPRNATVEAVTSALVGRIDRSDVEALIERRPEIGRRVWAAYERHAKTDGARTRPGAAGVVGAAGART